MRRPLEVERHDDPAARGDLCLAVRPVVADADDRERSTGSDGERGGNRDKGRARAHEGSLSSQLNGPATARGARLGPERAGLAGAEERQAEGGGEQEQLGKSSVHRSSFQHPVPTARRTARM